MELIYQQTSRLIDFQSLYIVLHNEGEQELRTVFDISKGNEEEIEKSPSFCSGKG